MTYLNKLTDLKTFMTEVVHRCLDNQGPTVATVIKCVVF